jgi:predicted nucleic acid-binding protein
MGLRDEPELKELLDLLARAPNILFTSRTLEIRAVPDDPDGDKFIACALALQAEVVITGDEALHAVGSFRELRIMDPKQFLGDFKMRKTKYITCYMRVL